MIASVLTLTRAECLAQRVTDAYSIHRVVYSLFPSQDGLTRDFLFADQGANQYGRQVLILSRRKPEAPAQGQIEIKEISREFLSHDCYGFEVRLNPTKRDKTTTKTVAIRGRQALVDWFCGKGPEHGFEVLRDDRGAPLVQVQDVGVQRFAKGDSVATHGQATFVGKLRVQDREKFQNTFEQGMGRAKSFGFGLLKIVPIQHKI